VRTSVTRTFRFEAAHQLPWHEGKCRNLHGHSYRLEVTVSGPLKPQGIVLDFADLRAAVEREVIDRYDHRYLNDLMDNPTAELIAHEIWKSLEAIGLAVTCIRLWETADSMVEVSAP
jgi:6-pyruvoyltetrahydropterin/6-carboxytetrahydropterin synthase